MYKLFLKPAVALFLFLTFVSFSKFSNKYRLNEPKSSHKSNSINVDTLYIRNLLKLAQEDSLIMHLNQKNDYFNYLHEEFIKIDTISKYISPFYIRTIISIYRGKENYSHLGSFRILYASVDDPKVFIVKKDSIKIILGGLDGIVPEQTFADINYDGYKDLIVSFVQNTTGRNILNFFCVFDPVKEQYIISEVLDSLFREQPVYIDESSKIISTGGRVGAIGFEGEDYRWNGSSYELFATYETTYDDAGVLEIKKELINGVWKTVEIDTIYTGN